MLINKFSLLFLFIINCFFLKAQVYHLSNDSISFIVRAVIKKDSVDGFQVHIINNTSKDMYLCKKTKRKGFIYINVIDGPIKFACGCEYGFNQDYANDKTDDYEVTKIASRDTLFVLLEGSILNAKKGRKFTRKEFLLSRKIFKIDYVLTNSPLIFREARHLYDDFTINAKRLVFSMDEGL